MTPLNEALQQKAEMDMAYRNMQAHIVRFQDCYRPSEINELLDQQCSLNIRISVQKNLIRKLREDEMVFVS